MSANKDLTGGGDRQAQAIQGEVNAAMRPAPPVDELKAVPTLIIAPQVADSSTGDAVFEQRRQNLGKAIHIARHKLHNLRGSLVWYHPPAGGYEGETYFIKLMPEERRYEVLFSSGDDQTLWQNILLMFIYPGVTDPNALMSFEEMHKFWMTGTKLLDTQETFKKNLNAIPRALKAADAEEVAAEITTPQLAECAEKACKRLIKDLRELEGLVNEVGVTFGRLQAGGLVNEDFSVATQVWSMNGERIREATKDQIECVLKGKNIRRNIVQAHIHNIVADGSPTLLRILPHQAEYSHATDRTYEATDPHGIDAHQAGKDADKPIRYVAEIGPTPQIFCDTAELVEVAGNVMRNAQKSLMERYRDQNDLPPDWMPEIRVRTRFDDQTKEVVITVTDNGRGVDVGEHEDHAVRHRLQQELVFGGGHSTQAGEDHGEGGRFCREAIERHNGSIKITSEGKFKGAEVEIRLPIGEPPQEAN